MFFYIVFTPISTTSGLWSTGNTRKYHQIDVYIYQCADGDLKNDIVQRRKFYKFLNKLIINRKTVSPTGGHVLQCTICHWCSFHYVVTHVRNKNSNIQGRSPIAVKVIVHTIRNLLPLKRDANVENHCLIPYSTFNVRIFSVFWLRQCLCFKDTFFWLRSIISIRSLF